MQITKRVMPRPKRDSNDYRAYGKAPISEIGMHFHKNAWVYFPLVILCKQLSPKVTRRCKDWYSNTGDGLNRNGARKLASDLDKLITAEHGSILYLQCLRTTWQWRYGPCPFCLGDKWFKLITDHKTPSKVIVARREILPCDCCKGIGHMRPISKDHFHVFPSDVREFARFCKDSGGFEIR
jgi:hypothetical protein